MYRRLTADRGRLLLLQRLRRDGRVGRAAPYPFQLSQEQLSARRAHIAEASRRPSARAGHARGGGGVAEGTVDVAVIGGGAAGLTAAYFAAREGARVTVLERTPKCGTKILMSGGSRCNVLPVEADLQRDFFTGGSASAMRAVFASWPLQECRSWLEDPDDGLGLELAVEEDSNKYFPKSNSAREVRDRLVAACVRQGVTFRYSSSVEGIAPRDLPAGAHGTSAHSGSGEAGGEELEAVAGSGSGGAAVAGHVKDGAPAEPQDRRMGKRRVRGGRGNGRSSTGGPSGSNNRGWVCTLADGSSYACDRLVIATGGLSFPGVGTDGTGHRILRKLGLPQRDTYPALTPLTGPHPAGDSLAGLSLYSVQASVLVPGSKKPTPAQRSGFLFTHSGFSGPAVLDLSHHVINALAVAARSSGGGGSGSGGGGGGVDAPVVLVNWTGESPGVWDERLRPQPGSPLVRTVVQRAGVRERLADALLRELRLADARVSQLKAVERSAIVEALTAYPLRPSGSGGYRKAEVTGGGLPLEGLNCGTMEARDQPGLHVCGEILDVFGRIGGFNFYWAWVSGRLAGLGAALDADSKAVKSALAEQQALWARWDDAW